jgi:hypothetical protein
MIKISLPRRNNTVVLYLCGMKRRERNALIFEPARSCTCTVEERTGNFGIRGQGRGPGISEA